VSGDRLTVIERTGGEKRAYLTGFEAGIGACAKYGQRDAEAMVASIEATLPELPQGGVADRDALSVMLKRLLDVALVDGYGETVRDEAEALLARVGGQ
jgi:hypothetical protein